MRTQLHNGKVFWNMTTVVIEHSISPVDWDYFAEVKKKSRERALFFGGFTV